MAVQSRLRENHSMSRTSFPEVMEKPVSWQMVAKAFTRPVLARMAQSGSDDALRRILSKAGFAENRFSLRDLMERSLYGLQRHYRCEYVYKAAIVDRIIFGRHSPRTASLHVELPVGRSIVDIAVFNGTSTAYEIKTELDSHRRLITQTADYLKAFERVFLVTHPAMVDRYAELSDERVGILALTPRGSLTEARPASIAPNRLDIHALLRLLRRQEYQDALEARFGDQGVLSNGRQFRHFNQLWNALPIAEARAITVAALRARTTDPGTVSFISQLPASCRVLGYATPLSGIQRQRLLNMLI